MAGIDLANAIVNGQKPATKMERPPRAGQSLERWKGAFLHMKYSSIPSTIQSCRYNKLGISGVFQANNDNYDIND